MSIAKIEKTCEEQISNMTKYDHVWRYGAYKDGKETGVAVICCEVDNDDETSTEINEEEKKAVRKTLAPHSVRFYPNPMLTFSEWRSGVEPKKNPIIGQEFKNEKTPQKHH